VAPDDGDDDDEGHKANEGRENDAGGEEGTK